MKIWEAIQMLEQMDKTKECTLTFGPVKTSSPFNNKPYPKYCPSPYVDHRMQPGVFFTDTPVYAH